MIGSRRIFLEDGSWYWDLQAGHALWRGGSSMISSDMALGYIEEASGRPELVSLAFERGLFQV